MCPDMSAGNRLIFTSIICFIYMPVVTKYRKEESKSFLFYENDLYFISKTGSYIDRLW